ncbi:MAG: hypothetical protein ABWY04_05805 [Arthrobacter sp.]
MKNLLVIMPLAALLLTGCGESAANSPAQTSSQAATAEATPTASATPTKSKSPRGNTLAAFGETRSLALASTKEALLSFTVKELVPITCDYPSDMSPSNGQVMGVLVDIETTPALADDANLSQGLIVNALSFKHIKAEGTTTGTLSTNMIYNCLTDRSQFMPDEIGPAEKVSGMVLVDVPSPATGTLIFEPLQGGDKYEYVVK